MGVCRNRGFTLVELLVSLIIIGTLSAVLLGRLAYYQETAERIAMETTVRLIKTGLQIRLAELIIANRQAEAAVLEIEDPVQWLERRPGNYGGVYHAYASPGTWYFDDQARHLVYVADAASRLEIDTGAGGKVLRFRAKLLQDRVSAAGGPVDRVSGVTLSAVQPYRWP
jgi:prepilin-type N-terminal cleavage/methylation domain-containing protein